MQNDKKQQTQLPNQALNLYGIMDNEMARMHSLLQTYMTLPKSSGLSHQGSFHNHSYDIPEIYRRIIHMQDILLTALAGHDVTIQNKVAELALTGEETETESR